ncbi:hypothetical protein [Sphingobacterium sp. GVS05A]|uniref:hypothetical protein n=1 Tax=Sphingobacterium TaxID=28453 RepID=UPI001CBC6E7A|nr:hypothetical protein [Sphingobacterium sp. GVS05A]
MDDQILDKIDQLSEEGNAYCDEENFREAIRAWTEALNLIPSPQNVHAESLWLEASIGDAYFLEDDFENALPHFENAKGNIIENAYENPFIMLRLGQCYLETANTESAQEYLLRAYMMEGKEIFEEESPKYFNFLADNVELD